MKVGDGRDFIDDLARSVAFLSRIPMPERHFIAFDGRLGRAVRAFPLAGALIALPAAAVLSVFSALEVDPAFAAFCAVALLALVTGALHEDGLADTADGLGGGRSREQALTIMKDSRIGTYGAVALILSFGLRVSAIGALVPRLSPMAAGLALLAMAALSRAALVWHWHRLPSARKDGVAASLGAPQEPAVTFALGSGLILTLGLLLLAGIPVAGCLLVLVFCGAAVLLCGRIVEDKIGGHTGDTLGATQQIAEIAALAALALTV